MGKRFSKENPWFSHLEESTATWEKREAMPRDVIEQRSRVWGLGSQRRWMVVRFDFVLCFTLTIANDSFSFKYHTWLKCLWLVVLWVSCRASPFYRCCWCRYHLGFRFFLWVEDDNTRTTLNEKNMTTRVTQCGDLCANRWGVVLEFLYKYWTVLQVWDIIFNLPNMNHKMTLKSSWRTKKYVRPNLNERIWQRESLTCGEPCANK